MSAFGWSASDIVAALQLLNKVRIALKDSGGASSDYHEESSFLQSLLLTLRHIDALRYAPLDHDIAKSLDLHCEQIRIPLQVFLSDVKKSYEASLGSVSTRLKLLSAPRKIQWALFTANKVKTLREKIALPMSAAQLAISQQIV